ncbi:MAG: TIGR03086 family metal-binding protein [Lapillicoccus sp.]
MDILDFGPTSQALARLVQGVRDDQLTDPTPCPDWTVGDLLGHVAGLTAEFTSSAAKVPTPARAAEGLTSGWRERVAADLAALAAAWRDPDAYEGETHAGPVTLSGRETALVALNEVTVHAWDLAQATGQAYVADPGAVAAATAFVRSFDAPADDGTLFGPPVETPDDAAPLDRLLGLTGRDPQTTKR